MKMLTEFIRRLQARLVSETFRLEATFVLSAAAKRNGGGKRRTHTAKSKISLIYNTGWGYFFTFISYTLDLKSSYPNSLTNSTSPFSRLIIIDGSGIPLNVLFLTIE